MADVIVIDLREPRDLVLHLVEQDGTVVVFRVADAAGGGGSAEAFLAQLADEARAKTGRVWLDRDGGHQLATAEVPR